MSKSIFDYLNNISNEKTPINIELEGGYDSYMINRFLSMDKSTILFVNEMNLLFNIPKKAQYLFYFYGIEKYRRFFKYHKKKKNINTNDIIKVFNCSRDKAEEIEKLLTKEQIKEIKNIIKGMNGGK